MTGITPLGGLAATSFIFVFLSLMSVSGTVAFIIIVIANRADPDPTGKRPVASYFFGGAFVTLWLTVIGVLVSIFSLVGLIGANNHGGFFSSELHPATDAAIRGITIGLLLVVIAGFAHVAHARRGLQLSGSEEDPASPTKRVERGYLAVVSFIAVVVTIFAGFATVYIVLGFIAPGVYHGGTSMSQTKALLDALTVLVVFAGVFYTHQRLVSPGLRLIEPKATTPSAPVELTGGAASE